MQIKYSPSQINSILVFGSISCTLMIMYTYIIYVRKLAYRINNNVAADFVYIQNALCIIATFVLITSVDYSYNGSKWETFFVSSFAYIPLLVWTFSLVFRTFFIISNTGFQFVWIPVCLYVSFEMAIVSLVVRYESDQFINLVQTILVWACFIIVAVVAVCFAYGQGVRFSFIYYATFLIIIVITQAFVTFRLISYAFVLPIVMVIVDMLCMHGKISLEHETLQTRYNNAFVDDDDNDVVDDVELALYRLPWVNIKSSPTIQNELFEYYRSQNNVSQINFMELLLAIGGPISDGGSLKVKNMVGKEGDKWLTMNELRIVMNTYIFENSPKQVKLTAEEYNECTRVFSILELRCGRDSDDCDILYEDSPFRMFHSSLETRFQC